MRQPSQKYSIKEDQKLRLHSNQVAQQLLQQEPSILIQHQQHSITTKNHDHSTQSVYDAMNLQNKQVNGGGAQRQLNFKMPIVQKNILNNNTNKVQSQTLQGGHYNQQTIPQSEDNNQTQHGHSINASNTGSFFRQAALSQFQREQSNHSPEQQQQPQQQQQQMHSQFYQSGFDHSDRSTTANTGFPLFSTKTSTFIRKPTGQGINNTTGSNFNVSGGMGNNNNTNNNINGGGSGGSGNSQLNLVSNNSAMNNNHGNDSNINNHNNLGMSALSQLQITGQAQKSRGLSNINRGGYKQMQHDSHQSNNHDNSMITSNIQQQRNNFQISVEMIGQGQTMNHKLGNQSYLTLEKLKNHDKNQQQFSLQNNQIQNQFQHQQSSFISGNLPGLVMGQVSAQPSLIPLSFQHSDDTTKTNNYSQNKGSQQISSNASTALLGITSQVGIQGNGNQLNTSPIQKQYKKQSRQRYQVDLNIHNKLQSINNSNHTTNITNRPAQSNNTIVVNSILNESYDNSNFNSINNHNHNNNNANTTYINNANTMNNSSSNNAVHLRDIKIRKGFQPQSKIQKPSNLRFQTAQLILDAQNQSINQQQPQQLQPLQQQSQQSSYLQLAPINSQTLQNQNLQSITSSFHKNDSNSLGRKQQQQQQQNTSYEQSIQVNDESENENSQSKRPSLNNRKRSSGGDKDQIILKTLNLEERKRLIKKFQQSRQTLNKSDDDFKLTFDDTYEENKSTLVSARNQQPLDTEQDERDDLELPTIEEEEVLNDDIKSQMSKIRSQTYERAKNAVSQSVTTLSSAHKLKDQGLVVPKQAIIQRSPQLGQFKKALFQSETFKVIFKKIKDGVVKKNTPEYEKMVESLSRISGISPREIDNCIDITLQQSFSEKFQNPYLKKSSSSAETIEENIPSASLNHSFSFIGGNGHIVKSGEAHSIQPSSGSSIWNQPLGGLANIVNGSNKQHSQLGGSYKLNKKGVSQEDLRVNGLQQKESKSNGNASDKRSLISKKSSYSKKGSSGEIVSNTSAAKQINSRRRFQNQKSSGSHHSTDMIIYKIQITKSGSGSQTMGENGTKEQIQEFQTIQEEPKIEKSDQTQQQRQPAHRGLSLEQIRQRNQSHQPSTLNNMLNVQKVPLVDKQNSTLQGQLIRWKELKKIGQGTQGEVFIAQNVKNFNFFVVKKLSLFSVNSGIDKEALMKLKKEIEVYRKLEHPHVIKYIGSEIVNNQFCIYLEYMSSGSLQTVYQNYGGLKEETIKKFTKQILAGLVYLHQNKVVHCDLKGANVLVDHNGVVKLSDFGCAKLFESSFSMSDFNGAIRGSLPWMAPEVVMNKGIRRKADIWSLGCLMIELAVKGNPWGDQLPSNNFQAIFKIADPNSYPTIPKDLSAECKDFIQKCLTREYDSRPTALELQNHPWLKEEHVTKC